MDDLADLRQVMVRLDAHEDAQMQEVAKLTAIFDALDGLVYVADFGSHEILYANAVATATFGDIVGKKCYRVLQGKDAPCDFCSNPHIFGENLGREYVWHNQNLINRRWYQCADRAIRWPDGRMVRLEIATDITALKQDDTTTYKHIVASVADMLALLDARYTYLEVNPSYRRAFGIQREDFIGRTPQQVFGEEFFQSTIKPHADRALAGETVRFKTWAEFPAAGRRFLDVTFSPYADDEKVKGFVVSARDISGKDDDTSSSQEGGDGRG